MSRHEGVSCDSCLKGNFRGRRYKCLVCYDYDLCATCYEAGATTTRHTTDHAMQCILTRSDFDLYYGGEAVSGDQPQSYTCPYCAKMGFSDAMLRDHVSVEHADMSVEIVCPICASLPGGDPNHMTDDFAAHLALDHRTPRDFEDGPGLRHVRRISNPGRGGGQRTRQANMHFGSASSALTGLSPSTRASMDPIADVREWMPELLSQLSSVRNRAAAQSVSSQLQQLEMTLQSTRQQLERMPPRQRQPTDANKSAAPSSATVGGAAANNANNAVLAHPDISLLTKSSTTTIIPHIPSQPQSQFLLAKLPDEGACGGGEGEGDRLERNLFVQELLLSTLTQQLQPASSSTDPSTLMDSLRSPEPESNRKSTTSSSSPGTGEGQGRKGGAGSGALPTSSQGREVKGAKNADGHGKSKNASGGGVPMATSKSCGAVNSTPGCGNSGRQSLSSPIGASVSLEGRALVLGAGASASPPSPPSPRSLLSPSSRPPLYPQPPIPSSSQPQAHGSTVNLNEHAMGLSPRQASAAAASVSARDSAPRLNTTAAAKRSILKHLPANRGARDTDPPPH